MRADRLVQLLLFLQRRPKVTAAQVAEELEVSERTARRDLEALAMSGVPIYSTAGRGGGWQLIGGATTDLSGFTEPEARALFLLAAGATGADPTMRDALHKIIQAVPSSFRPLAQVATSSVIVDPESWGHTADARPRPEHLETVTAALFGQRRLNLVYVNSAGRQSTPTVNPLGVIEKRGTWYLVASLARPEVGSEPRSYRVDRIEQATITDQAADRPDDFDLAATWHDINANFARESLTVTAWGWATPGWRFDRLRAILGRRLTEHEIDDHGRVRIEIASWSVEGLVGEVAALGAALEIESPSELVEALAELGAELRRLYA